MARLAGLNDPPEQGSRCSAFGAISRGGPAPAAAVAQRGRRPNKQPTPPARWTPTDVIRVPSGKTPGHWPFAWSAGQCWGARARLRRPRAARGEVHVLGTARGAGHAHPPGDLLLQGTRARLDTQRPDVAGRSGRGRALPRAVRAAGSSACEAADEHLAAAAARGVRFLSAAHLQHVQFLSSSARALGPDHLPHPSRASCPQRHLTSQRIGPCRAVHLETATHP